MKFEVLAYVYLSIVLKWIDATSCTSRYGERYTGTCMSPSLCTGATLNNLCPGSDKCCIDDTGSSSTSNDFISRDNFLAIVGNNTRTRAMYDYLQPPTSEPTCFQTASYIAQLAHESSKFLFGEELGSESYFEKYDGKSNLGNTQPGDGAKFRGRGFIQITGRANYKKVGSLLGLNLTEDPELAAFPSVAAQIAVWYWQSGSKDGINLNDLADGTFYNYTMITYEIQGGIDRLLERTNLLKKASDMLDCGPIARGQGKTCRIDGSTLGTCRPLCVTGMEDEQFCGCEGSTYSGKCAGPKTIKCCLENINQFKDY